MLGIIGAGAIGKYLAKKASAFGMKVVYHNRRQLAVEEEAKHELTYYSKVEDLLSAAGVVSIGCPLNSQTTNLISHEQFASMRYNTFLVNTAPGPVIDEDALIDAMESGKVTRAGLDVFCDEPKIKEYFKSSDRVIL